MRQVLETSQQREAQVYVVITMRSDFLGDCTLFKGLPEAINESQYLTPRLIREQCRAAIVGPAKVCRGDVEPALVNRLLNDFGPDPDQLPLLQHALLRMWTRATDRASASGESANETLRAVPPSYIMLTGRDYEELGGLSRALSDHADEVLKELTHLQRRIAEIMFRRLTERGVGKRDMRTPAHLSDVAAVAGVSEADVTAVVETFRGPDRCFVTPRVGTLGPDTLLDIGHASLIRQWRLLSFTPEPVLAQSDYEEILRIMKNMAQVMELSPRAFLETDEEALRTHFLLQLNGVYEGDATGETFNFDGKTDILIRKDGKNVFVAECKFWKGEKAFLETIDQLLTKYVSWRDTKTAMVLFNRNAGFSAVLAKIADIVPKHPHFKRDLRKSDESTFRYVFGQPNDANREIMLTVMAFDIPTFRAGSPS
jgi:hypothetical protein